MIYYDGDFQNFANFVASASRANRGGILAYFVEVSKSDGYYIDAVIKGSQLPSLQKIPVLQSPYFSPIVKKGDVGLIININVDLSQFCEGLELDKNANNSPYFVFLPLCPKASRTAEAEALQLTSADGKHKITITADGVSVACEKDFEANGESIRLTAKQPLNLRNSAGSVGEVLTEILNTLDALKASAVVTGSATLTWTPQYDTAKAKAKSILQKVLK